MFKNKNKSIVSLSILILLVGGILIWKINTTSGETDKEVFNQEIRNALAELNFPNGNNNDAPTVSAASANFANFISYRSGVQLNQSNKDLLSQSEQSAWSQSKRITTNQLAQILTDVSIEKLVILTDSDINNMSETLRGFNPPGGLPQDYQDVRGLVKPRSNGEGTMNPSEFIAQLKSTRNTFTDQSIINQSGREREMRLTRTALYNRLINEISKRTDFLTDADPNFFGQTKGEMTPMQAMLVTYSVVADDRVAGNQVDLQQKMSNLQQVASQFGQEPYPNSQGYKAYGVNGYIYSSPTDILLDNAGITRILTLINQEGGI